MAHSLAPHAQVPYLRPVVGLCFPNFEPPVHSAEDEASAICMNCVHCALYVCSMRLVLVSKALRKALQSYCGRRPCPLAPIYKQEALQIGLALPCVPHAPPLSSIHNMHPMRPTFFYVSANNLPCCGQPTAHLTIFYFLYPYLCSWMQYGIHWQYGTAGLRLRHRTPSKRVGGQG